MWRRVASQSPISTPDPGSKFESTEDYLNAWDALGKLLANGGSLSGRERNCCFLNTGRSAFANISAVSGFDFPDDARGVATTDWDADGDLDVWVTNRSQPRIRFLRNENRSQQHFLAVKLTGTKANRDAIGSKVEVATADGSRLVKTLRAGEGYLAQSSKWLHFGLGQQGEDVDLRVTWPDRQAEVFRGLAADRRFSLVQGTGEATEVLRPSSARRVDATQQSAPQVTSEQRIVLPARVPFPTLTYRTLDENEAALSRPEAKPMLVSLWATWCRPCLVEIADWSQHQQELAAAGLDVVLLCVDEATRDRTVDIPAVSALLERLGVPFRTGFATADTLDTLDVAQQILTKRIRSMPVPTSFLVDGEGRLAVVYKGAVQRKQLISDVRQLGAPVEQHRDHAVAFSGRWYTNPFPPDVLAIPRKFREQGKPARALDYLLAHVNPEMVRKTSAETASFDGLTAKNLSELYVGLGMLLEQAGEKKDVARALRAATQVRPDDLRTRMALVMVLQQEGQSSEVAEQFREMLKHKPGDPVISNNLAWLLATGRNQTADSAAEAIQLAEMVCQKSQRQLPAALDTLAAAYASAGQFESAVSTASEALSLMRQASEPDQGAIQKLQTRLQLYRNQQPFIDEN